MSELSDLLDKYIEDGVLTVQEHEDLMTMIHADGKIDDDEKAQISRLFALIKSGQLRVVDPEREASELRRKEEVKKKLLAQAQAAAAAKKVEENK